MITEFTCGIYTAIFIKDRWTVNINDHSIGEIDTEGTLISFNYGRQYITQDMLIELAVLMNNIKRQFKQLNQ